MTLSPKQNWDCGGLHLSFDLSQRGKDGVCCQKSQNPAAGRLLPLVSRVPYSHMGTLRLQAWLGGGLPWVTEQGVMTLAGQHASCCSCGNCSGGLHCWGSTDSAFQVLSCQRGESAVGPGTHPGPWNSVSSVLIRQAGLPRKSLNNHKEGASGHR